MRRRNQTPQAHIIANSRGQGNITFERLSVWMTLLGIYLPGIGMILLRVLLCLTFGGLVLMVGRQSGGLIAFSVAAYQYLGLRMRADITRNRIIPLALLLALPLIALDWLGYWLTNVLDWSWDSLRMYYSWMGGEFLPAPPILVTVRAFSAIVVPLLVWAPARAMDWALLTEIKWPKARETNFAQADPASVPGSEVKQAHSNARVQQDESETNVLYIPAPKVVGQ